jgi:hypothetical protein
MFQSDQIARLLDTYVKQLEGLEYSKNATMATKLVGAIDTALLISGFSASAWQGKVDRALVAVMADKPSMPPLQNNLPDVLAAAVTLPTPQQPNNPPVLHVVPPMPKI